MKKIVDEKEFEIICLTDLNRIKEKLKEKRNEAMVNVNSHMIEAYYEIGKVINERKKWGNKYVEKIALGLKECGSSFSVRNLQFMSQFARTISPDEMVKRPVSQIPWRTIITLIQKCKDHKELLFYIDETYKKRWSQSMVLNQIEMKAYERNLITPDASPSVFEDEITKELFEDTYIFNFLDEEKIKSERDFKNQMIDNVIDFINELGVGFTLVGKEYKIAVPNNEEYYIDLLMYNIKLHLYLVIEVKIRKFQPSDLGQLLFYVNAVDDLERVEGDNNTIGLVLCKDANSYVAKTSLKTIKNKIGISKYKIIEELPQYLEKRLKDNKKDVLN